MQDGTKTTKSLEAENVELRAELQRLRERLEFHETVDKKSASLVYVFDHVRGGNVFTNRDLAEMLGYNEQAIRAMGDKLLFAIMHPDDVHRIPAQVGLVLGAKDGETILLEYRLRTATGEYRWVEDRIVVFTRNPDGSVRQHLGTLQDITARKRQEADERLVDQAVLRGFLEHTPAVMFVKDLEGRYILVNQEMERLAGIPREQILGTHGGPFLDPAGSHAASAPERRALAEGQAHHIQNVFRAGETLHYQCTTFRIEDQTGTVRGVGTVAVDVTRELERATREAEALARQSALLRELASPLLPIAEHILAMPIIGTIDESRAQLITETLLLGVSGSGARVAILDITGLRDVDGQAASAIVNAARAVKLLGAEVVVTGMRPSMARALVESGANLENILTLGTLRSGIAWAMGRKGS